MVQAGIGSAAVVVGEEGLFWGASVEPGNNPVTIIYVTKTDEIAYPTPLGEPDR